jgi:hypothetical protein
MARSTIDMYVTILHSNTHAHTGCISQIRTHTNTHIYYTFSLVTGKLRLAWRRQNTSSLSTVVSQLRLHVALSDDGIIVAPPSALRQRARRRRAARRRGEGSDARAHIYIYIYTHVQTHITYIYMYIVYTHIHIY